MKTYSSQLIDNMKLYGNISVFIFLLIWLPSKLKAQTYSSTINFGQSSINYQVKLIQEENQTWVFYSSMDMNAYKIPCQKVTLTKDKFQFFVISDYYTYEYNYIKKRKGFKGNLKISSNDTGKLLNTFDTKLSLVESDEDDTIEKEDFTFMSNDLKLSGTLWKPGTSNEKALFFVTTSQGNDRSGNNAEAQYFTKLGYTVFNYDKRGTGKSEGDWQSATIEELCKDDMNALRFFSETTGIPLSKTVIKGSSQGGIKVPYILTRLSEIGFGISVSCPSGSLLESDLNNWQQRNQKNIGKENIQVAANVQKSAFNYVAGNITYESLQKVKNKYIDEEWMNYVWIPEQEIQKDPKLNFSGLPYFKELVQPILVIQGLSDEVIPISSYKIIKEAISVSKASIFNVITLKNTSHSMTSLNPEFPYFQVLAPDYLSSMTTWLSKFN